MLVIHRILCPVDFSEPSERALEYALGLAERHGAEVDVVHVFQFPTFAVEDGTVALPPFCKRTWRSGCANGSNSSSSKRRARGARPPLKCSRACPMSISRRSPKGGIHRHGHRWRHRAVAPVVGECGGAGGARFRGAGADHLLGGLA